MEQLIFDEKTDQLLDLMYNSSNSYYSSFANIINAVRVNVQKTIISGKNATAYICALQNGYDIELYLLKYILGNDRTTLSLTLTSDAKSGMMLSHQNNRAKLTVFNDFGQKIISSKIRKDTLANIREEKVEQVKGENNSPFFMS